MHTPLITIIQTRTSIIRELILHITKRHQPSHFINNLVGFTPSVDGLSFYLPGGCRATNAEEVLEVVEGWALWWQRPRWSPERKHNKLEGIITGLYGHMLCTIYNDRYFYQNKWKITLVYKKKRHHIDPPFSRQKKRHKMMFVCGCLCVCVRSVAFGV